MLKLLAAAVFALIAPVTAVLGLSACNRRARALERMTPRVQTVTPFLPSPSLIWGELVNWAGSFVPASSKDLPRLKRLLVSAGFRNPGAVRLFQGARGVSMVLVGAAGALVAWRFGAAGGNLLLLSAGALLLGYMAPVRYLGARLQRRKHAIERGLPHALDLMVVCVESGLGLDQTTIQVAKELLTTYPEICDEFTVLNLEIRAGKRRAEALHNLAERAGVEDLKKLVAVLIQTDRFGTSVAQSLRGHSEYIRVLARQRAEERAAKIAVKLVFPIFFCVLPALFVVTIGPVLTEFVRELIPMLKSI